MDDYEDSEDEREYNSGPYCRHWGDPSDCSSCEELCLNCGHKEKHHDNLLEEGANRDELICIVSFDECTNPYKTEAMFDDEGFCICSEFIGLED